MRRIGGRSVQAAALTVLILGQALAQISSELTDGPASLQFRAWIAAINSGDLAQITEFQTSNLPAAMRNPEAAATLSFGTGGFDLRVIEETTLTRFVGLLEARESDDFWRLDFEVEPESPHTFVRASLQRTARPDSFVIPRMTEAEAIAGLHAEAERKVASDRFSGAVLVARNEEVLFERAYGPADHDRGTPNTVDTRFRIGSMNKMFTAASVLQLVQAGRVELMASLATYVADYPNEELAAKVTIHHLLTHTGGTGDFFGPEYQAVKDELRTLDDYMTLLGERGLEFEPGTEWKYSNYGYILLGIVIERVSGQSYYDYVDEHIYEPAGMTASGSEPENRDVADQSVGYMRPPGSDDWQPNSDTLPFRGTSAGGGYSTVRDLFRFARALLGHKLLDARHTDLMTTGVVETGWGRYGYGLPDFRGADGAGWVGHNGAAPGMNGDLKIYPKSGYVTVVLSNLSPPSAIDLGNYLYARLPIR
ncbi:MAG TPA: serine hydrolase domain-containing protein [Gammaproteobacteria bacterium]|jgi:CubicO group peptidase (beta-lactamase class C family)